MSQRSLKNVRIYEISLRLRQKLHFDQNPVLSRERRKVGNIENSQSSSFSSPILPCLLMAQGDERWAPGASQEMLLYCCKGKRWRKSFSITRFQSSGEKCMSSSRWHQVCFQLRVNSWQSRTGGLSVSSQWLLITFFITGIVIWLSDLSCCEGRAPALRCRMAPFGGLGLGRTSPLC